jgi:multidrug transporter EmrE-like cation transporter
MIRSFLTGLIQVFLVAYQTRQISHGAKLLSIFLVAIGISLVWVFNVRSAVGSIQAGISYALAAGIGTVLAMKMKLGPNGKN